MAEKQRALEADARRLRAFLEAMRDVVLIVGPDGRYLDVAPTRPDLLYRPAEQVLGRTIHEIFPREQAEFFQEAIDRTLRTRQVVTIEYALPIEGREVWFEGRLSPMLDEEGRPVAALLVARDITERRQAQEALRESEEKYRTLVEQSSEAIYLLFNRRFEFINRRFSEMFGIRPEEACAPDFDFIQLVAPQSRPQIEERAARIQRGEAVPPRYEFTALTRDGREIQVEASVAYVPYRGGIATQGVVRDITAQKKAEAEMLRRERYLACLADTAQKLLGAADPFAVLPEVLACLGETAGADRVYIFEAHEDEQGRLLVSQRMEWCAPGIASQIDNPAMQNLPCVEAGFGRWVEALSRNEPIVGKVADFPPAERPLLEAQDIRSILVLPLLVGGLPYGFIGFDSCRTAREWEQAEIDLLSTVARNIAQAIEKNRALRALRESEERYRRLIELLPDAVAVHQDGLVRMVNLTGARMLGYESPEEVIGRPALEFVHPDDRDVVRERIRAQLERGERAPPLEERFLHRDGHVIPVEVTAAPFRLGGRPASLVVIRDVSARKRLEEELRQAQKMEALGRLAGGVAHDFNNLLTAINGYTELLLSSLHPEDPLRAEAEAILKAGQRAAMLTQQLLAFGRRQVMELRVVNLNQVLEGLAGMLRRLIREDIELAFSPDPGLGPVRVDVTQMEQAIVNLVVNARDAMPGGGRLTLETANVDLGEEEVRVRPGLSPGRYVRLTVSDTGEGIPEEVREHLFEPFFTTKEVGMGLGLATVYGVVRQFGGFIQVESEPGRGSTFRIYLPRVEEPPEAPVQPPVMEEWPRGWETVLVVEDDEMVRDLAVRVLRGQGYRVLEARRGDEAIRMAAGFPEPVHLLLTDVLVPHMSSRVLLERLREHHPEIRVLYMSGHAEHVIARHAAPEPGIPLLRKPFTPQALAQKVRAALEAAP
ncbi:MAG: PAS domain S-box protein [Chloroflexia bacterium]